MLSNRDKLTVAVISGNSWASSIDHGRMRPDCRRNPGVAKADLRKTALAPEQKQEHPSPGRQPPAGEGAGMSRLCGHVTARLKKERCSANGILRSEEHMQLAESARATIPRKGGEDRYREGRDPGSGARECLLTGRFETGPRTSPIAVSFLSSLPRRIRHQGPAASSSRRQGFFLPVY